MVLENKQCHIVVKTDDTYTVDSADNQPYDVILNPGHYCHNDFYKTLSISVDLFSRVYRIALIGAYHTYDWDCAVLDGDILTVLQDDAITQLNVTDGSIIRHIQFECLGCNFAIYKIQNGYIIYGEMQITMLDFNFNKKWSFSGRDIFASVSGKTPLNCVTLPFACMILRIIIMNWTLKAI